MLSLLDAPHDSEPMDQLQLGDDSCPSVREGPDDALAVGRGADAEDVYGYLIVIVEFSFHFGVFFIASVYPYVYEQNQRGCGQRSDYFIDCFHVASLMVRTNYLQYT